MMLSSALADAMACMNDSSVISAEMPIEKPWVVDAGPGESWTLVGTRGLVLQVYGWPAESGRPRLGTVMLFHGIDANIRFDFLRLRALDFSATDDVDGLKYERSFVAALNTAGFDCVGADIQGFGVSESATGDRGYFERFEDLVDDAELVCKDAASRYGDQRLYFVGISYGGLLAASLAARLEVWRKTAPRPPPAECTGLVLLAPALSLERVKAKPTNAMLLPLAALLSQYAPTLAVGDKPASPHFPQLSKAMERDAALPSDSPHCTGCYTGNLRARVAKETLDATDRLADHNLAGDLADLPAILLHSRLDTMCDPEGSAAYADANKLATLTFTQDIPGCEQMWHVLTQEPGADVIFDRVAAWLQAAVANHDSAAESAKNGARIPPL